MPIFYLTQQRQVSSELIHQLFRPADADSQIGEVALRGIRRLFNELVVGLTALRHIGEINYRQSSVLRLIEPDAEIPDFLPPGLIR